MLFLFQTAGQMQANRDEFRISEISNLLNAKNHEQFLRSEIKRIKSLSFEEKAQYASEIANYAREDNFDKLHRTFLYKLQSHVAGALVSVLAQNDYSLSDSEFRKKNGPYKESTNNCRQYALKLYSEAIGLLIDPALESKKMIYGRPTSFDWSGRGGKVVRMSSNDWSGLSQEHKKEYLSGKVVFIEYHFNAKDVKKISEFLEPGDLIGVNRNPRTPNAHVGVCDSEGEIIHIGKPLYKDSLGYFLSKAKEVSVYKLAKVEMDTSQTSFIKKQPLTGG
ncbi:MAG: hypothetical protein WC492_03665 [Candidatus Micrarchaeia archaeon]